MLLDAIRTRRQVDLIEVEGDVGACILTLTL